MELRLAFFIIAVCLITIAALDIGPCTQTTQKPKNLTKNKSIFLSAFTQIKVSSASLALSEQEATALNLIPGCKPIEGGNSII